MESRSLTGRLDPQTDSIVRVHVNRLRHTLKCYYADQTPPPPVKFEIPKGSYVARSVLTSANQFPPSQPTDTTGLEAGQPSRFGREVQSRTIQLQRLTYERGDLTNAAFCPGEESVVYSARWYGERATIYSQRIGQKHSRPLGLPPAKLRDVSTTGQLLFTLGEGATGVLAQAELSGGPWREIVDGVSDAVWLPDNRNIAAARVEGGTMRIELPLGNPIHYLSGHQRNIRLKVDDTGQRLAFLDSSLRRMDLSVGDATGQVQRISKGWRLAGGMLWLSQDRLLFSGARHGSPAIYTVDLQGAEGAVYSAPMTWDLHDRSSSGRILASFVDGRLHVAFRTSSMHSEARISRLVNTKLVGLTPDGKFAVLRDLLGDGPERNSPILLLTLPDGEPVQVAEGFYPQLSADGKAVICLERVQSGAAIVVTPIPSGLPHRYPIANSEQYHSAEFAGRHDRFLVHLLDECGRLHTKILDGQSGRLSTIPGDHYMTLVSPNGEYGVVPGCSEFRIAHLETGEVRSIRRLRPGWSPVRWSTDGNEIFVFEPSDDVAMGNLSRINILTGEQEPWLKLHPADSVGVYLLNWLDVTPDGRSYAYTYQQDLSDLYVLDGLT